MEYRKDAVVVLAELEYSPQSVADESFTLRGLPVDKSKTGGWKAAPFMFSMYFADTIGHLGVALNLVTYLVITMHQSNSKASTIFANFMGTCFITSVGWAFVADAYLGRYWTILVGSIIMFVGLLLLTLSTAISSLEPDPCTALPCEPASGTAMETFYAAIYLIAVGSGGIKPCLPPLGGDQFDDSIPAEKKQRPVYFNLLFCSLQTATLFVLTGVVYIQDHLGRRKGFGIPLGIFAVTALLFFAGTPFYRHKKPAGSPFTRIAQVMVAAFRKRSIPRPADASLLYEISFKQATTQRKLVHTPTLSFLDKAAILTESDIPQSSDAWKLCPVTQVEEVKRVLRVLPVWVTSIIPYILFAQISSYAVIQSISMDRHMGPHFQVPYASFGTFALIITCLLLPLYQPYLVPLFRRITRDPRGLSPLARLGTGLFISIFSMVSAAAVEVRRKRAATHEGLLDNPLAELHFSAFWLVPQIGILGLTEVFLNVGLLEFFYEEVPDGMRSLGTSLYCSAIAIGYFISSFLVTTVTKITRHGTYGGWLSQNINRGDLQKFYSFLAILSAINFCAFLLAARFYKYKKLDLGSQIVPASRDQEDTSLSS